MEILRKSGDYNIILNQQNDFQTNLGWEEGMDIFEDEVLSTIINPIDNYETVRYIHQQYSGLTGNSDDTHCDIWYKFYFIDSGSTYTNGLDYSLVGIKPKDNAFVIAPCMIFSVSAVTKFYSVIYRYFLQRIHTWRIKTMKI